MQFTSSLRIQRLVMVASLLVPLALFVGVAWKNHSDVARENGETIIRTTAILHEHARKVFETADLLLGRVDDYASGLSWREIAAPETSRFLARIKHPLDQAISIWMVDPEGMVRAGTQSWDPTLRMVDRDFFDVQRRSNMGDYVSAAFVGKATGVASFAVSRRLSAPDSQFNGTVHVALSPDYFAQFFAEATPKLPHFAMLIRADGAVLAQDPNIPSETVLAPDSPILRQVQRNPDAGFAFGINTGDGTERLYAYRKIAGYPVYVTFGIDTAAVAWRWHENLLVFGALAGAAAILLFFFSWRAYRAAHAAQGTTEQLHSAMEALRFEIGQREAAEQRVRQTQKMEAVGQLTGGIAHDFNNLLTAVMGSLEMLRKRIPLNDANATRLLDNALDGAQRGAALTQRLLSFGRRQTLQPAAVDLPSLVNGMRPLLRSSVGAGVQVVMQFPIGLPAAYVDANQLELALLNLAVNARDAMDGKGQLTITAHEEPTGPCRNDTGLADGAVVLRVIDTGIGMDEATLARATEPFFTTKGVGKGTGLGLSMVHGMAGQSGGRLILRSGLGAGTTAELWLPRAKATTIATAHPIAVEPRREPMRSCVILLVDDDPLVLASTALILEDLGHQVIEATNGHEALHVLRGETLVDLVITDQAMPGMTGVQLATEIYRRRPGTPVILATGLVDQADAEDAGMPILNKPFDGAALDDAIRALLRRVREPRGAVVAFHSR